MSGGKKTPVNELILIPKVAALLSVGRSTTSIAEELSIAFNTVRKIAGLDETRAMVKEIGDSALAVAKATIKKKIGDHVELACEVLHEHLKKERSLDAVKLVFKVAGVLADEPVQQNQGPGTIQVILPGQTFNNGQPTITVESSECSSESPEGES